MTKKQIEKCTWKWQDYLGLNNWDIVIVWKDKVSKNANSEFPAIAQVETHPQYKLATIYYNPKARRQIDTNAIVHELLHCLIAPLIEAAKEHTDHHNKIDYFHEQVTAEFERIIMRLNRQIPRKKNG